MSIEPPLSTEIVDFWRDAGRARWFKEDEAFDTEIRARFEMVHLAAARGEYGDWAETPTGALGLVLALDQFPRNLYRDSAHAFATDAMARHAADWALASGHDRAVDATLRFFFYMPFEHSEDAADQRRSLNLFRVLGDEELTRFAILHHGIIARFGRFPHRNAAMGRDTTPEEVEFLADGGFNG